MALLIYKAQQIVKHELYDPSETGFYCAGCPHADAPAWHRGGSCGESVAA